MSPRKSSATANQTSLFRSDRPRRASTKRASATRTSPPTPHRQPGKKIWLSPSGLGTMERCPRCFWLQYNLRIYQPEGIVSRLANRFDAVIKRYFDLYRGTPDLPPLVAGQIEGRLESPFQEIYFATINDRFGYKGKLDECVQRADGTYTVVDHKTASSDPTTRELLPAYQFQLDSYAWLLQQNHKPPSGLGHLIYFFPVEGHELHRGFPMQVSVKTLQTKPERVPAVIDRAVTLLDGTLPAASQDCQFCRYVETVKEF